MTKAADLALGKIAAVKTALIEFTDGDDAIAVADAGVVTLLTTAVAKSEGGAVTTNIAQGVAKQWIQFNGSGTVSITDSFNTASLTDVNTGEFKYAFSNNMNNTSYCADSSCRGDSSNNNNRTAAIKVAASTEVEFSSFETSSGNAADVAQNYGHTMGDLA